MKAWRVNEWCEPEQMELAETPVPEPGPNEVRIRNRAAALNFYDILMIQGKYQVRPPLPFTPGTEVAGTVDAVGAEVTGFGVGDDRGVSDFLLRSEAAGGVETGRVAARACGGGRGRPFRHADRQSDGRPRDRDGGQRGETRFLPLAGRGTRAQLPRGDVG